MRWRDAMSRSYTKIGHAACIALAIVAFSSSANADDFFVTFDGAGRIEESEDVNSVEELDSRTFVVTFDDSIRRCGITSTFEGQTARDVDEVVEGLEQSGAVVITVGRVQSDRNQLVVHSSDGIGGRDRINVIVKCNDDDDDDDSADDDDDDDDDN
jgi:hypothetical protein